MQPYVALLRGINVGGHRVTMERLRELFVELGFASVETFIASGNVFFQTPETDTLTLETRIEAHLKQALGYEVATFFRTPAELTTASAMCPFTPSESDSLYVTFLKVPADQALQERLQALQARATVLSARSQA